MATAGAGEEGWELGGIGGVEQWEVRRAEVVGGFELVAGRLPERDGFGAVDVELAEVIFFDLYERRSISFDSGDGDRVTAYLYVPNDIVVGEKRAGIVAMHPTHEIGKGVVDGQGERPNREYGRELAELGYVVLAPDYVSFGERGGYDFGGDGYVSGTMKGIWDHLRCVDLLVETSEVDGGRIGAIGHSLGGHNAIFLGLYDRRVKVVVSSCGWTPFRDYYEGRLSGWSGARYLPRIEAEYGADPGRVPFDFYGLVAALAPRAFFSNSPTGDGNFEYRGVEKVVPGARAIYSLYGVPEKLRLVFPECGHDFPEEVRFEAYRFLGRELGR
ncbi:MAG: alpha/beta fold hydrolase [Verrucomicrobiales bacterium]|nr:alpha/beta fold hydrolase [Verrucomicrobiales bacterium]